jgi:hypothetical protein
MTHDEMIEVIQAHKDGKVIQLRSMQGDWIDVPRTPDWDFPNIIYRPKPEPKEYWLVPYGTKLGYLVLSQPPFNDPHLYVDNLEIDKTIHVVTIEELTND